MPGLKSLFMILLFICLSGARAFLVGISIPVVDSGAGAFAMMGNIIIYSILALFAQVVPGILHRVFVWVRQSQASTAFYLHLYFWGGLPLHVISFLLGPEAAVFSFLPDLLLITVYKIGLSLFAQPSGDG
jgi:hypothetical protein